MQQLTPRRVALLTLEDRSGFFIYEQDVVQILNDRGWVVEEIPWSIPTDWNLYDFVIVRSTWDYHYRHVEFIHVMDQIEQSSAILMNPLPTIKWNANKLYLHDLEKAGVRIVPTVWMQKLYESKSFEEMFAMASLWKAHELVMKPTVSANAKDTVRWVLRDDRESFFDQARIYGAESYMVQPFLESIQTEGEFSLVYFDRKFSHCVRKVPANGDFRVQEEHGGTITSFQASSKLIDLGHRAVAAVTGDLLYARADFVIYQDEPCLMELELIEPSLYFPYDKDSSMRFVDAFEKLTGYSRA